MNRLYIISGNLRTFFECFDSCYNKVINKLFKNNNKTNTYILLYLKSIDPGPKEQKNWNFNYKTLEENLINKKIEEMKKKYNKIKFIVNIVNNNEIDDYELLKKIKCRSKYIEFLSDDKKLIRGMHFLYNFKKCNSLIDKIEKNNNISFDLYIYIRPDLYFTSEAKNIQSYDKNKITLGYGAIKHNNDHIALIPKKFKNLFFNGRLDNLIQNDKVLFPFIEKVYRYKLDYNIDKIGDYYIKR